MVNQNSQRLANGLSVLAFTIAFFTTTTLMIGDQLGRVNLLYILLLFVFLPLFTLLATLLCTLFKAPLNITSMLLSFPFWPRAWLASLTDLKRLKLHPSWLFLQSQKLALVLSCGSLLAFFVLLLFSDVVFVWRSTLLSVDHVYPVLNAIAQPWFFVESAQPVKEQVALAQDSRLLLNPNLLAADIWWRYIFMAQCCYVLLPRLCMYAWGYSCFKSASTAPAKFSLECEQHSIVQPRNNASAQLQAIASHNIDLSQTILLQRMALPDVLQKKLFDKVGIPHSVFNIENVADSKEISAALKDSRDKVILVPAWEPPLGELEDFMRETSGTLLVLDWVNDQFQKVEPQHLDEWRRFCFTLPNWQLVVCEGLT